MDERSLKNLRWIVAGLLIMVFFAGCIYLFQNNGNSSGKFSLPSTDPETGVRMWTDAVKDRNIERLYDLAPDEIKEQITFTQFKKNNVNNTLFQSDYNVTSYHVIDKKQNGTFARIITEVNYPENHVNSEIKAPLMYVFDLFYEHGEWKIWVDSETGLQTWIAAVNAKDIDRVYDLSPDALKEQISLAQFKEENANNSFLHLGNFQREYGVVDKTQNATFSQIIAVLTFNKSADNQGNSSVKVPISYRFGLFYEHGEWKILTLNL